MKDISVIMRYIFLAVLMSSSFSGNAQFGKLLDKAKEVVGVEDDLDISGGLKEALNIGVEEAVSSLSVKDGYFASPYKVLVPEEAQKIVKTVSSVPGLQNVEKDLVAKMNEAAELAVVKAGPIFLDAIKGMSIKDATSILMGEQDAATRYLDKSTRGSLYEAFLPVVQASLDEVDARSIWNKAVNTYNKIPLRKKLNPDLDDHVASKALDGVFGLIEVKEEGIREDVGLRTSPLLQEVFAKQDK